ncbi:Swm1p KNAG_0C06220 [Huiozyma naganishii CBS 8797]|uniref:Uncharacterized protein n=1 Tax=Huiozyma naganishii (strain ATCC MYA-139 / BCRC 22969 / CBS 8797 / KCTC 17520 / NBRC 10181 / NCYC 3082 / Yp74L-3) TaxID=1071383 RepID=J7RJM8_HUIN7|nr:hypothetical protein KNAG_0C06220 [Kazachstania naganishii CBS 8797]CCK69718.1 hypothetical protein KNAG_0C06220 [Kazachstania naganishii CBS 8797]
MASNFRDSSFQYQHLRSSHHALYQEWLDDVALPPPDQTGSDAPEDGTAHGVEGGPDSGGVKEGRPAAHNALDSTQYWDYFDDEEAWQIFNKHNLTVESNGRVVFHPVVMASPPENTATSNSAAGAGQTVANTTQDCEEKTITGSIFDPRVLAKIRKQVTSWEGPAFPGKSG